MFLLAIICTVLGAAQANLQNPAHEYPLMDGIKRISEEIFPPGHPLVIVLPLVEEHSTREEVGYLIQELHTSSRWPIIVVNVAYGMNRNMKVEINQHGSYIILVSGTCQPFTDYITSFWKQLVGMASGAIWQSWNPRARFVIPVMTPCARYDNTYVSQTILNYLWLHKVTNGLVVFQESSGHVSKELQQNISDEKSSTYFSLHTWFAYENSQSCMFDEGDVPLKSFSVRNFSDIQYSGALKRQSRKNLHGCPMKVLTREIPYFVDPPYRVWNNYAGRYEFFYFGGVDIKLLTEISKSLNMSPVALRSGYTGSDGIQYIASPYLLAKEAIDTKADIVIGGVDSLLVSNPFEGTHSYYNWKEFWYAPCAIRHSRWSRIFKIFSIDLWLAITLFLLLAVIAVHRISNYGYRLHLNEHTAYGDATSISVNMTAVALGVSVSTQPRTTPLRVFFVSWVCYCIGISTVFQAYLTSFLIDTGYKEPFKTLDEVLNSGMKVGLNKDFTNYINSSNWKYILNCPDDSTCFEWAVEYQNISILVNDWVKDILKSHGYWTDENNRPLLCKVGRESRSSSVSMAVLKGSPLLEYINGAIDHIVEAGLLMKWKNQFSDSAKLWSNARIPYTAADTYVDINVTHLQSVFYMLLLGYTLALVSFIVEIIWCNLMSEKNFLTHLSASYGAT